MSTAAPLIRGHELQRRLGGGDGSTLWAARSRADFREVTLEVVDPEIAHLPGFAARLQAVAQQVAALRHPRVIGTVDVVVADGAVAVVEEAAHGVPLAALLDHGDPLPPTTAVTLADDVLRAIAAAHGAGVVHCGLTPSRVLVDEDGGVRLGGFAMARALALTGGEAGRPRPGYASPERLGGALPDGLGDLYAAAALTSVLLTGRTPAPGASPPVPEIPGMSAVLQQAVAPDPGRRQPSATALRTAITQTAADQLGEDWRDQGDLARRARAAMASSSEAAPQQREERQPVPATPVPIPEPPTQVVAAPPQRPAPAQPRPAEMAWQPLQFEGQAEQPRPRRRRTWLVLLVALLVGAAAAAAIVLGARSTTSSNNAGQPLQVGNDVRLTYTKSAKPNCADTFTFTATGSLTGSGTLTYRFVPADPGLAKPSAVSQRIDGNPGFRLTYPILYQGQRSGGSSVTFEILSPTHRSVSTSFDTSCH